MMSICGNYVLCLLVISKFVNLFVNIEVRIFYADTVLWILIFTFLSQDKSGEDEFFMLILYYGY